MPVLRVATWNINSIRIRLNLLADVVAALQPDVLCLQETKVPDPLFPLGAPEALGYPHVAVRGMKGYNGVAVLSRVPMRVPDAPDWCGRGDCRHLHVELSLPSGPAGLHNFYVPAGGDVAQVERGGTEAGRAAVESYTGPVADTTDAVVAQTSGDAPETTVAELAGPEATAAAETTVATEAVAPEATENTES